jgi:hypothetical protein
LQEFWNSCELRETKYSKQSNEYRRHLCRFQDNFCQLILNRIGFEHWSGQTKDYENDICCLSAYHEELRSKSKDLLARNQDNVVEWSRQSFR